MRHHKDEPSAGALARGPAKTSDIESTRRDLVEAERRAARMLHAAASRHRREAARRAQAHAAAPPPPSP
jgi:hypothetical protein